MTEYHSPTEYESIYRRNFLIFLADFVLFGVGINLIGSTTVIPDFVRKLTDSEILIALSGQMFEVGWLLPQLLVARRLMSVQHKKWWFIGPNIPVRPLMLVYAGVIVVLGANHTALLLGLFILFYLMAALGDGLVGVPWLDLMGSSLDSKWRARLFGFGTASSGVIVFFVISRLVKLILSDDGPAYPNNYALLFALASIMFVITIPIMLWIKELPGGTPREVAPMRDYLPELVRVLREDGPYRAMIITRVLTTLYTLAGAFYIGFATEQLDLSSDVAVSNSLAVQTAGSVGGALLFSWLGDRRSLLFIRLAILCGVLQPALALSAAVVGPITLYAAFCLSGVVSGSLGISFMNWVVGYASPDQRPIYSGLFNSISAVGLLVAPLLGGLVVQWFGYETVFATALVIMLSALAMSLRLTVEPAIVPPLE